MKCVILCSAIVLPLIAGGQERRDEQNRPQASESRRYEDSAHRVHEWDASEDQAYRRYLQEHHKKDHDFAKASKREQNNYWKWRQSHPDENRR